ncbi:MAG: O-acetyl-ADP-ribose deacetylase [Candidatus Buchananbacteria bacterium RBG_13_36_9]|uniref:O-acetyl-ADP-ribose deacetylase n=1 Tax=Candidatus Buchananbacteria bacterium RBG_13_36_9 TaxID=1797530 RepID=A0A1G1XRD1_9BACT|nr:MAG: O-acetyl-ADP-ribose deacetylase [Candidatus Buchananbacteria bacterium RBG_13_36_9]
MLDIEIQHGDITKVQADAIVNPANSLGWMGGGSASAIKKAGGKIIEDEVVAKAPLEIGRAVATTAGDLPYKSIIHAPTMETPAEKAKDYNVAMSVRGALLLADDQKMKFIAMPGMGTGIGNFPKKDAAKVMIEEIKKFEPINLEKVILIDIDEELVKDWQEQLKKK